MGKIRECGGLYNTGKCCLTRKEFVNWGLNEKALLKSTKVIRCLTTWHDKSYRLCECPLTLKTKGLRRKVK